MTTLSFCTVEQQGPIFIVTINRPEVRNALHRPASLELDEVFNRFAADPTAWIAVVTGAGDKAFCAGNDLKYQAAGNDTTWPASGFGGLTGRFDLNKPVIAAVNGLALGGGFEIALACDLIIADEHAEFALPEPHVGLAATAGGLLRLPQQIGMKRAMDIILTGRRVTAAEGRELGFVNEVAPAGEVLDTALAWARRILAGSPMAIRAAKALARQGMAEPSLELSYPLQKQLPAVAALYASADKIEGPKAFAEKRKPVWQGC
ncbi:enoyl-CoA hydratase-related protein [Paraburkholderia antibiotica]|uniref:Enoyl-CoA hydratase n=1 Tax=Paraburkholderia antibiotica TaxID=2728839 RepID=A0A7X9ZY87_9BURK|nr:enoyl-CoA hydratase-related protein [Paraburkholderia antibiotica]NML32872.1 enoyl-CoA hydratase [Paraburkholderia antibiotica]